MLTEEVKRIKGNEAWNQFPDGFLEGDDKMLTEDSGVAMFRGRLHSVEEQS